MSRFRRGRSHRARRGTWHPRGESLEPRLPLDASGDFPLAAPDPGFSFDFSSDPAPGFDFDFDFGSDSDTSPPPTDFGGTDFGDTDFGANDFGRFGGDTTLVESLNVEGTDPPDGATIDDQPSSVTVHFDRPLDPFSLGLDDVYLEKLDGDSITRIDAASGAFEELDQAGAGLVLRLSSPLETGRYRVVLSGFAFLMGSGGELLDNFGQDQTLAEFQVVRRGVTLDQALDLGTPGSSTREIAGSLDLAADPSAVALYRFTLPAGRSWRFGAEVAAERLGSPLDAALTLFDAAGRPIAVASLGRPDAAADPYLFDGLEPGTYYLGVSQDGNRPDLPGGYDLALGRAGLPAEASAGGRFKLRFVADPIKGSTQLIDSGLDYADPDETSPTGFHLQFSGPMLVGNTGEAVFEAATQGVEVVDKWGQTWPVAAVGYDESSAVLSYIFRTQLPAGQYTVRLSSQGGLEDLGGRAPVARGQMDGVLARFNVKRAAPRRDPNDLGVLFPNSLLAGVEREVDLQPGESVEFSYFNLYSDFYNVLVDSSGGTVHAEYDSDRTPGFVPFSFGGTSGIQSLSAGHQRIRLTADGDSPVHVRLRLSINDYHWERLLQNGLGQGYALEMRLNTPGPPLPTEPSSGEAPSDSPSPPGTPSTPPAPAAPSESPSSLPSETGDGAGGGSTPGDTPTGTTAAPSGSPAASPGASTPRGPAGLLLAFGGQPVGRPSETTTGGHGDTQASRDHADGAVPLDFEPGYAQGNNNHSALDHLLEGGADAPNPALPDLPGGDEAGEAETEEEEPHPTDGEISPQRPVWVLSDLAEIIAIPGFYDGLRENLSRLIAFRPVVADAAPAPTDAEGLPGESSELNGEGPAKDDQEKARSKFALVGPAILVASAAIIVDQSRRYLRRRRRRLRPSSPTSISHGRSWPSGPLSGPKAARFGAASRRPVELWSRD